MKILAYFLLTLVCAQQAVWAESFFPKFEAERLNEEEIVLPGAFPDAGTWLIVGFTKASQASTTVCAERLEKAYPGRGFSMAVLEGIPFFIKGTVKKAIRNGVPAERKDRYLFLYDGKKEMKKLAGFDEKVEDDAYIIGVGKKTTLGDRPIVFLSHGNCSDAHFESLKGEIKKL